MTAAAKKTASVPWRCPRCGATASRHGSGGRTACASDCRSNQCTGFLCECLTEGTEVERKASESAQHGTTFAQRCPHANCHHCGWGGAFPPAPKRAAPWEQKALAHGWTPPPKRAREMGIG